MNPRERIIRTFRFEKTDRIPRYEIFLPEFITRWREVKKPDIDIYEYYSKIDIGTVIADQNGPFPSLAKVVKREGEKYYEIDSWGRLLLKKDNAYFEKELDVILDRKDKLDRIKFEDIQSRYENWQRSSKEVEKRFAPVSGVLGLFMACSRLRGDIQFLIDIKEDIYFCKELLERLMNFTKILGLKLAEVTDTKDTAIWIYDELAGKTGPIISPEVFSNIFLPYYKEMIDFWKSQGIRNVVLHCDGNCSLLLDLIIEAGFTGIQGIYPSTGMKLPEIKRRYDRKLVLIGGICNIGTLRDGSYKDIKKQVEDIIEIAKDGGIIIGSHSIGDDIPIEKYDYYYSVLNEFDNIW